ncbi:MAG: hypothetical protein ABH813_00910 [Patescibacteria group bacterium]
MTRSKLLLGILILLALVGIIFVINYYVQRSKDITGPAIQVVLSWRGGLLGADDSLTITNDGRLIYVQKDTLMEKPITTKSKLSSEELKNFKKLILESSVFNFRDDYGGIQLILDLPGKDIEFSINGKTKKIFLTSEGAPELPEELEEILNNIYEFKKKFD